MKRSCIPGAWLVEYILYGSTKKLIKRFPTEKEARAFYVKLWNRRCAKQSIRKERTLRWVEPRTYEHGVDRILVSWKAVDGEKRFFISKRRMLQRRPRHYRAVCVYDLRVSGPPHLIQRGFVSLKAAQRFAATIR